VKLCGALQGRRADAEDTRALLEPYAEWAGLASVYLLAAVPKTEWRGPAGRRRSSPLAA
jgi:3-methyladenine DNA glycosylase/8-oxoguanine DNA glycosylase